MKMHVIGTGVGRTGTYSLKLAINQLKLGPCHHMEAVLQNQTTQVPLWNTAIDGAPDWPSIYHGFQSAVDWPTACFFRELNAAYPEAKFILTVRSPESWADSFSATIYTLLAEKAKAPEGLRDWLEMAARVIAKTGFPSGLARAELMRAFTAHNEAVQAEIPADRLLIYQVKEGWGPLCEFLNTSVPEEPFPRTNDRSEFWDLVSGAERSGPGAGR